MNQEESRFQGFAPTYWYWMDSAPNAGDVFNRYLVERLYDCPWKKTTDCHPDAVFCGSILMMKQTRFAKNVVGCGFQSVNRGQKPPMGPTNYLAIRGETTRQILSDFKVDVSDDVLLCDPGLMLGALHPVVDRKTHHRIGIIPHHKQMYDVRKANPEKHVISIQRDSGRIDNLADEILDCDMVVSSSLHGIIFAHSLGVPAYYAHFRDLVTIGNGDIKFKDYYSSFSRLEYRRFHFDGFKVDEDEVAEFDSTNRNDVNPTMDEVHDKQKRFVTICPFNDCLNKDVLDAIG